MQVSVWGGDGCVQNGIFNTNYFALSFKSLTQWLATEPVTSEQFLHVAPAHAKPTGSCLFKPTFGALLAGEA